MTLQGGIAPLPPRGKSVGQLDPNCSKPGHYPGVYGGLVVALTHGDIAQFLLCKLPGLSRGAEITIQMYPRNHQGK